MDDLTIPTKTCTKCEIEKPLIEFGIDPRYRGGHKNWCYACVREYRRAWVAKDIEKERLRWKTQRESDPQGARDRVRRSYEKHAEERREKRREYAKTHRAEITASARTYRQRKPFKHKEHDALARARKHGVVIGIVDYERIAERDKRICHICGLPCEGSDITFDHIVPLSKGGPHTPENVAVAHYKCNHAKNDMLL